MLNQQARLRGVLINCGEQGKPMLNYSERFSRLLADLIADPSAKFSNCLTSLQEDSSDGS